MCAVEWAGKRSVVHQFTPTVRYSARVVCRLHGAYLICFAHCAGPRYGVLPGYGITMQNGFEDVRRFWHSSFLRDGFRPQLRFP